MKIFHMVPPKWLATLAIVLPLIANSQNLPGISDDEVLIVRQRVNSDYKTSHADASRLVTNSRNKNVTIESGETLSSVISKQYSVGTSNAKLFYEILKSAIQQRNSLGDDLKIKAGSTLTIPDLPPIAKSNPNPSNILNKIAKLSVDTRISVAYQEILTKPTTDNVKIFDDLRQGASEVVQIRYATRREARELGDTIEVMQAPITINLANEISDKFSSTEAISSEELSIIKNRLSGEKKNNPVLVILDDGWPDLDSYVESTKFLSSTANDIREKFKMGKSSISSSTSIPVKLEYTLDKYNTNSISSAKNHASLIKRSIAPFKKLENSNGNVKVIFIPIFISQKGSYEILQELLEINYIAQHMKAQLGDQVPNDVRSNARIFATTVLKNVSDDPTANVSKTDQVVIEAVLKFFYLYGRVKMEPYFINMSWTTPDLEFDPHIPTDGFGLSVVAAGNEGDAQGTTVFDLKRQFASRSVLPGDMLAVMNAREDGKADCGSSLLETGPDVLGFSFPGSISEKECGTSFSAPRVAWLIAARESMLSKPNSVYSWTRALKTELKSMRNNSASGFNKIKFNVTKLFDAIPPQGDK